jgi:acetyltransferase-like isoleucine patch superfamily enzyme
MKNKIRQFLRNLKYALIRFKYLLKGYRIGKNFVVGKQGYIDKKDFEAGNEIYIGPYHYISSNTKIGNFCLISDRVHIVGHDHTFEKIGTPTILAGRPEYQPETILEDDVWIGHAVTIIRGVKIAEGSIVGANSLVTKDIPPYSIYGGVPAKFIRMRFSSDEERIEHSKKIKELAGKY